MAGKGDKWRPTDWRRYRAAPFWDRLEDSRKHENPDYRFDMAKEQLRCEECDVKLPAVREETPVLTAVKAKNAGVWVKNFVIYGDESGYHFFCCPAHGKAWRVKNIGDGGTRR